MVAEATPTGPAETADPGKSRLLVSANADRDELAVAVHLAVRSEANISLHWLTDGADTDVRKCVKAGRGDSQARAGPLQ